MRQAVIVFVLALFACSLYAEEKTPKKKMTHEQAQRAIQRVTLKKTGGHVRKANSAKGLFVILNDQSRVNDEAITSALAVIDNRVRVQTKAVRVKGVDTENIKGRIKEANGCVGVALVESDTYPSILAAPESGWTIINVAALAADKPEAAVLASRVRKEILRGFAFVAGGCYSSFGDFVMRDVVKPADLDSTDREDYSIQILQRFSQGLAAYGLTPWNETTYLKACQEGWASEPTNEYQKAIWEQVHSIPTKPIKIEFDPKTDRK